MDVSPGSSRVTCAKCGLCWLVKCRISTRFYCMSARRQNRAGCCGKSPFVDFASLEMRVPELVLLLDQAARSAFKLVYQARAGKTLEENHAGAEAAADCLEDLNGRLFQFFLRSLWEPFLQRYRDPRIVSAVMEELFIRKFKQPSGPKEFYRELCSLIFLPNGVIAKEGREGGLVWSFMMDLEELVGLGKSRQKDFTALRILYVQFQRIAWESIRKL